MNFENELQFNLFLVYFFLSLFIYYYYYYYYFELFVADRNIADSCECLFTKFISCLKHLYLNHCNILL